MTQPTPCNSPYASSIASRRFATFNDAPSSSCLKLRLEHAVVAGSDDVASCFRPRVSVDVSDVPPRVVRLDRLDEHRATADTTYNPATRRERAAVISGWPQAFVRHGDYRQRR
jgi:hypothetical protein